MLSTIQIDKGFNQIMYYKRSILSRLIATIYPSIQIAFTTLTTSKPPPESPKSSHHTIKENAPS